MSAMVIRVLAAEFWMGGDGGDMSFVDNEPQYQHCGDASVRFRHPTAGSRILGHLEPE